MSFKNTLTTYGLASKLLHWITALCILTLLTVGFLMTEMPFNETKLSVYALHKSFGLLVLLLLFIRVVWHILSKKPKSLPTHAKWEKGLAHAAHAFLYVAMFALPLSGWIMSSAGDFNIGFFGIPMPDLVAKNEDIFKGASAAHATLAIILVVILALHIAGALKHHFIDRDETLARMTRSGLGFKGGVLITLIAGALMLPPMIFVAGEILEEEGEEAANIENNDAGEDAAQADTAQVTTIPAGGWAIDKNLSTIKFTATQYGQPFEGSFGFDGQILFDPENLASAKADITIDISSIKTGASDRDGQAKGAEWFDATKFPVARFETQSFENKGANTYLAKGTLTIRDKSLPLDLPFTLDITKKDAQETAHMTAEIKLNRLDFSIGQGQWQSTDAIGGDVKVIIDLTAGKNN